MQSNRIEPKRLITHRFKLHNVIDAYDTFAGATPTQAIKVILESWSTFATCNPQCNTRHVARHTDVYPVTNSPMTTAQTPGRMLASFIRNRSQPGLIWYGAASLFLAICAWTAFYTVPSDSLAVVQRFGKYYDQISPGLHFKLPLGIDRATLVPVKRQLKLEFGFTTKGAGNPYQGSPYRDGTQENQMVTGDLNAALVEWVVQYRISDPVKFLFEVREPSATLRYVSESVMRKVVGDRTVDEVITIGRQEIEDEALTKMQTLSTKYAMGISIDQVQLKNINPPGPVQESFNEVNQAQQEKEKLINEARRDYNKVIPLAEGEKDQRIREADGYRLKRINEAEGDVARFNALFAEYSKAPEVTRRRIYIETLQAVMPGVKSKVIIDDRTQNLLPLLDVGKSLGVSQ